MRSPRGENLLWKLETILNWINQILAQNMRPLSIKPSLDNSNVSFPLESLIYKYSSCQITSPVSRGSFAIYPIFLSMLPDSGHMNLTTHPCKNKALTGQDLLMAMARSIYPLVSQKHLESLLTALIMLMHVRELDLAMCSPSSNGSKMRSLWTNHKKS